MMTVLPSYAGLHDWDGIQFAHFAGVPVAGTERSNNNTFWDLYDKPHILTLLPAISNMMRRGDVEPSERTLQIANDTSSITYPLFHTTGAFSLSAPVDTRMGIFRRLTVADEVQEEESFLPHLEISALSGDVDPTAFDAENGQILYDQTLGIMRVITPRTMSVTGRLANQIVNERDLIVEQVSAGDYTAVVLSSLTDSAVVASPSNLLVIASRGVNEGAVFNQNNTALTDWGDGPMQLEGRTMRVTVRAPEWDSCFVTPLGADARPMTDKRRSVERSPTGRFSMVVETNVDQTPWYLVEFSRVSTSVDEEGAAPFVSVAPNPVYDGSFTVRHIGPAQQIEIIDMTGSIVRRQSATGEATRIQTLGLASGVYTVMVDGGRHGAARVVIQ